MTGAQRISPLEAIEVCWKETFPGLEFLADVPWRDTGADSLKSTLFMLQLEAVLGTPVPLDNLDRDTTPRQLASAIERQRGRSESDHSSSSTRPAFLLPGLLGDEPRLAAFRGAFPASITFQVLKLPDIERTSRELSSIPLTASLLCQEIERLQPEGPLRLLGYSVGGVLAHEVAAQLIARGREVSFLGLLDPFLRIRANMPLREEGREPGPLIAGSNPLSSATSGIGRMEKLAFGLPLLLGKLERARLHLVKVAPNLPLGTLYWRRQRLIGRLRWRALRRWRPQPLDIPAVLVSSDEAEEHFDVSEWSRLLPRLERVHVGGTHLGLFEPRPLAEMMPVLAARLDLER